MKRRQFLRGLGGVTLGLPMLSSLLSKEALAQTEPTKRFIVMMNFNGVEKDAFWPSMTDGALSAQHLNGTSLSPLANFAEDIFIPRGVNAEPVVYHFDNHQMGSRSMLTSQIMPGNDLYPDGPSIDWSMATALGQEPLNLGVHTGSWSGRFTSIREGRGPVATEDNPYSAYDRLVNLDTAPQPVRDRLTTRRQSILDIVGRHEFNDLYGKQLSISDRQKLDEHYELVRSVENDIVEIGNETIGCSLPDELVDEINNSNGTYPAVGKAMLDIAALAASCASQQVITIQWNELAGGPQFNWDGIYHDYRHHPLSHRSTQDNGSDGNLPEADEMLREIDSWYAGRFAYLLDRLKSYPEDEGSVLDNSMVMWMNALSDGRLHSHNDMPYVIAGKLGGYIRSGRFAQAQNVSHSQIFTTALNGMGIATSRFGTHGNSGEYADLKA